MLLLGLNVLRIHARIISEKVKVVCSNVITSSLLKTSLTDRTNGRTYPLQCCVRRLSVCLSSVTLCIVTKRCVLEQKLLLRAYRKSYMRKWLVPK